MTSDGTRAGPLGVGVIGLGFMGATHVAAYQSAARDGHPCKLVAVCDGVEARRRGDFSAVGGNLKSSDAAPAELAFDPAAVKGYEHAADLLADPAVRLVSVCTPTDTHADLAIAAMEAGKHVLVEKPVALTAADVARVADAARRTGMTCTPAMCMRFWPAWAWLKRAADSGEFGRLTTATFTRLGSRPGWSADFYRDAARSGGALIDLHVHDADFVAHLFGPPAAVTTTGTLDHVTTIYHYPDGPAHAVAEGGWDQADGFGFTMRYVATFVADTGEPATARFDLAADPQLTLARGGKTGPVEVAPHNGYDGEVRATVDALAAGKTPPVTIADGVAVARQLDAERASLQAGGRRVELAASA